MNLRTIITIGLVATLCSCQKSCQKWRRNTQVTKRDYSIQMYSGGRAVFQDSFHGILNEEEGNGCFYYKGDTLIELAGDYVVKSLK